MVINQFPARFGRYILLDRLAAGGMAEVFRAKVTGVEEFERLVAIKCMLPQLMSDEQFVAMFRDEARLASQLIHANIVQIYEPGRLGERLYIAMELVNGRDLRHILRSSKNLGTSLPPNFAAYIVAKAAEGLDFAHRKLNVDGSPLNLVHRDVSPQNILVSYDGEIKVVDFGIAKAEARTTETQAGVLKGKFAYMAPEQVTGAATDRRADIFALGSVLYEMVTGQRLFTGDTDLSVLEKVRSARLPNFADVLPPGGEELGPILVKALARKPDDRYSHASELAEDLERVLVADDRTIFGSKRAAQVMRTLYSEEISQLAETLRSYATIGPEQCVVTIGDEREDEAEQFSQFAGPPSARAMGGSSGVTGMLRQSLPHQQQQQQQQQQAPRQVAIAKAAPTPARKPPSTARQREAAQAAKLEAQDGGTRIDSVATDVGASRVVRHLRLAFILSLLLTGGLVAVATMKLPAGSKPVMPTNIKDQLESMFPGTSNMGPFHKPDMVPAVAEPVANVPTRAPEENDRQMGYVNLRGPSSERVRIYVDGRDVGLAPVNQLHLTVGKHEVRLVEETTAHAPRVVQQVIRVSAKNTLKAPLMRIFSMRETDKQRAGED